MQFMYFTNATNCFTGVTANCLHPGMVDSGIWRNVPFPLNIPLWLIVKTCFKVNPKPTNYGISCLIPKMFSNMYTSFTRPPEKELRPPFIVLCRKHYSALMENTSQNVR